jgi:endonuclease/exonuclease/phosphatase (EEP) superfamily protein YafD
VLAIEAFGLGLCGLALIAPRLHRDALPGWTRDAPRITIGVANVLAYNPTMQRTAAELVHSGVDVLVINEVTDTLLALVDDLGGSIWFPHRIIDTGAHPLYTTAVFSHRPFGASSGVAVVGPLRMIRAELDVDGVPLTLVATHLEANLEPGGHARWRAQVAALTEVAARATTRTIIAGDFNASVDRPPLDELLERGYTDAHDALGRGLDSSLKLAPAGPLAALGAVALVDHVLTGGDVRPVEITRLRAPGSDHVPFAVTLAVRKLDT